MNLKSAYFAFSPRPLIVSGMCDNQWGMTFNRKQLTKGGGGALSVLILKDKKRDLIDN